MKKYTVLVCMLVILLAACPVCSFAEETPDTIAWVMEYWEMEDAYLSPKGIPAKNYQKNLQKRVIKQYDLTSGECTETEIPTDWIPLQSPAPNKGLFFAVETPIGAGTYDVICWRADGISTAAAGLQPPEGEQWGYCDGSLYTEYVGITEDGLPGTPCIFRTGADGPQLWANAYTYDALIRSDGTLASCASSFLSDDPTLYLYQHQNAQSEEYTLLSDSTYVFEFGYGKSASFERDDGAIMAWRDLSEEHIPCIVLRCDDMSNYDLDGNRIDHQISELCVPIGQAKMLVECLPEEEIYRPALDEAGNPIVLWNLNTDSFAVYSPEMSRLFLICSDSNSSAYEVDTQLIPYYDGGSDPLGRTMLLSVSTVDGTQQILYETGYEKPDYDAIWRYYLQNYGTFELENSAVYPSEPGTSYFDCLNEIPLEPYRNGIMEFFPENFSIYVH